MNEDTSELTKLLKSIKRWSIVSATGLILVGLAAIAFSVSIITYIEDESPSEECITENASFTRNKALDLIEQDKLDEVIELAGHRLNTHPNDADAHWTKAKAHYLKQEWTLALEHLDKAEHLYPNWKDGHTEPMRKRIMELK